MKFIVPSSDLLQHLLMVNGAIVSKPVIPILENFLFDIRGGMLTISSTDLETSMTTSMQVEGSEDIKVAVPSKMTVDILRTLPDQPITFTVNPENQSIELSNSNGRYKLAGQNGDDFPEMPAVESENSITVPANILLRAIHKTLFATGNDELRLNLTGIFVEMSDNQVNFVATDANRLVKFNRTDVKPGFEHNFILPKKALNLLKTSLPGDDSPVTVEYNKSNAFFSFGKTRLICRLIDQRYPDYNAVIPTDNTNIITIGRSDLLNSIKRISIFSNKQTQQIRLKVTGSELNISAEDIEMANEAQERLSCEYDGNDMEIGFNSRYLIDMLSNMDGQSIQLQMSAPNRAALLVPSENEENESIVMLIMPMMLSGAY